MSNSMSDEYQTPLKYINAAREVMQTIELDPASSEEANKRVKADYFFSKEDSGLLYLWWGNVWLNPPYSKPNLTNFTDHLISEVEIKRVEQSIYLVPSSTSEKWYQKCLRSCAALNLPNHRIEFILNGRYQTSPKMANTFFYFGANPGKFAQFFVQFGKCFIN